MAQKVTGGLRKLAIVRPSVIATTFSGRSVKFLKQQQLNLLAAAIYAVQALLILLLGKDTRLSVSLHYLAKDPLQSATTGHTVLVSATQHWFDVHLGLLLALTLFIAALCDVAFATVLRTRYEQSLGKKLHDMRWFCAGIVGALQSVAVATIFGVQDAAVLVALIGASIGAALGLMAVEANRSLWPWSLFAGVSGVVMVAIGLCYLLGGVLYGATLPAYAYGALALLMFGAVAAATNLWLQIHERGRWADYVYAEMIYTGIGLVMLTAMAWTIFFGALR